MLVKFAQSVTKDTLLKNRVGFCIILCESEKFISIGCGTKIFESDTVQ